MRRCTLMLRWITVGFLAAITACAPKNPTAMPTKEDLTVSLLYPIETTMIEMGNPLKTIIRVTDAQGNSVKDAQVTIVLKDPGGEQFTGIPATFGDGDVYRTDAWPIPHKAQEGNWTISAEAKTQAHHGATMTTFHVENSTSEMLLYKYGFWINDPKMLMGSTSQVGKELGDAQNGMIIWGSVVPSMHIFKESWVEIHWREGNFNLKTGEDVRRFMLNELGDFGQAPVRELGQFEQTRFKTWDAWQNKARGQFTRYDMQWMVFYAPEVNKTYAIATTIVQAPPNLNAHAFLRDNFEVHPEVHANGVAPQPLLHLLPAPELVGPKLGARYLGNDEPIILKWKPVKTLAEDEYYLVTVDYNYVEANPAVDYTTRETQFTLPESLYQTPNCGVFNWRVTLMKQTGISEDGNLKGEPISFRSLYWYVEWFYPPGEDAPFDLRCPNPQT